MVRFCVLLMAQALAIVAAANDVTFTVQSGDGEQGKYGVYFTGDFSKPGDFEKYVDAIPNAMGNKVGIKGVSGHGWVVRSTDLKFRVGVTLELAKDNKYTLGIKNLGEDSMGVRWLSGEKGTAKELKQHSAEAHVVASGNPVWIGEMQGKTRLMITVHDPPKAEL